MQSLSDYIICSREIEKTIEDRIPEAEKFTDES